jgi:hypothetical protein
MTEPNHPPATPLTPANASFRLTIEFDSENRVLSASVNGTQISGGLAASDTLALTHYGSEKSCCTSETPAPASARSDGESCCSVEIPASRRFSLEVLKKVSVQTVIATLVVALLQYAIYRTQFHDPDFVKRYGWWLFYLDISIIPLVTAMVYLRAFYYEKTSHMMGMMIGMTIGMQVGTMVGAVLGATNGFFIGALVGMLSGVFVAMYAAWCCGPMAVLHSLMGGIMGGTMGSMIIVMMMMDHVLLFMPVFTVLNITLVAWFIYLYYKECSCTENLQPGKPVNGFVLAGVNIVSIGLISALMLYGPKGPGSWMGEPADMSASNEGCIDDAGNPFEAKAWQKPCKTKGAAQMACGAMMNGGGG